MLEPFVSLIFQGTGFVPGELPVEALTEVSAYRELVVAVARDMYRREHPAKHRIPRGFDVGFELLLTGVAEGSASPTLQRLRTPEPPRLAPLSAKQVELFGPHVDYFDAARDVIEAVIAAGAAGKPLPAAFNRETLVRFNAFGRTLTDDDSIIVAPPNKSRGAVYNRKVRSKLLAQSDATFIEETEVVGLFRTADLDTNGFALRTLDGEKVPVSCPPELVDVAKTSFYEGAQVRVGGLGVFSAIDGNLLRIADATDVQLAPDDGSPARACSTPLAEQVGALGALAPGLVDGPSAAYDPHALAWCLALLTGITTAFHLTTPFVHPTPEGHVRVEWPARGWNVALKLDVVTRSAVARAVSTRDDMIVEVSVQLTDAGAESTLGAFVSKHLNARDGLARVAPGVEPAKQP
jgi:hypothetical protein